MCLRTSAEEHEFQNPVLLHQNDPRRVSPSILISRSNVIPGGVEVLLSGLSANISIDLRDASTTPLNFTKSINLALSERGINSMKNANSDGLLNEVLNQTIDMDSRMIHGRRSDGGLFQESQIYDINGRV